MALNRFFNQTANMTAHLWDYFGVTGCLGRKNARLRMRKKREIGKPQFHLLHANASCLSCNKTTSLVNPTLSFNLIPDNDQMTSIVESCSPLCLPNGLSPLWLRSKHPQSQAMSPFVCCRGGEREGQRIIVVLFKQ